MYMQTIKEQDPPAHAQTFNFILYRFIIFLVECLIERKYKLKLSNLFQECLPVLLILSDKGVEILSSQEGLHLCLVATVLDVHRDGHGLQDWLVEEMLVVPQPLDGAERVPVPSLEHVQTLCADILHSRKLAFSLPACQIIYSYIHVYLCVQGKWLIPLDALPLHNILWLCHLLDWGGGGGGDRYALIRHQAPGWFCLGISMQDELSELTCTRT